MRSSNDSNLLLGEVAYKAVRDAIVANKLKPGDRISEYKVAEWLNISRTPAREGLRRLEAEGFLTATPRRGLVVASVDDDAIYELYAAREILEAGAAALAARNATDAELVALEQMVAAEAAMKDSAEMMFEHNRLFHRFVYRAARNRYLTRFLQSLYDTLTAHRSLSTMHMPARREAVLKEHRALCQALMRRDEAAASRAAVDHVRAALRARMQIEHANLLPSAPKRPRRSKAVTQN
ncbi:MAG TPA: GntR family transcriptional regulator [Casimicrobiaceae bacterium]|nr:GntR family transcriptional regulator [Casimicrobiaceae bacterium]